MGFKLSVLLSFLKVILFWKGVPPGTFIYIEISKCPIKSDFPFSLSAQTRCNTQFRKNPCLLSYKISCVITYHVFTNYTEWWGLENKPDRLIQYMSLYLYKPMCTVFHQFKILQNTTLYYWLKYSALILTYESFYY